MTVDVTSPSTATKFNLNMGVKTSDTSATLAHGVGRGSSDTFGLWELRLNDGRLDFSVFDDAANESSSTLVLQDTKYLADGLWHEVSAVSLFFTIDFVS